MLVLVDGQSFSINIAEVRAAYRPITAGALRRCALMPLATDAADDMCELMQNREGVFGCRELVVDLFDFVDAYRGLFHLKVS